MKTNRTIGALALLIQVGLSVPCPAQTKGVTADLNTRVLTWPTDFFSVNGGVRTTDATYTATVAKAASALQASATNGMTSIVFSNPAGFYLSANPSNLWSGLQVSNAIASATNGLAGTNWVAVYVASNAPSVSSTWSNITGTADQSTSLVSYVSLQIAMATNGNFPSNAVTLSQLTIASNALNTADTNEAVVRFAGDTALSNRIISATQGLVGVSVTNGLAGTGYVNSAVASATQGMTSIVFSNPAVFYPGSNPSNFQTAAQVGVTAGSSANAVFTSRVGNSNDYNGTFSGTVNGYVATNAPRYLAGLTNGQTGVTLTGTFSGNGGGLTNLAAGATPTLAQVLNSGQITTNGNPGSIGPFYVAHIYPYLWTPGFISADGTTNGIYFDTSSGTSSFYRITSDGPVRIYDAQHLPTSAEVGAVALNAKIASCTNADYASVANVASGVVSAVSNAFDLAGTAAGVTNGGWTGTLASGAPVTNGIVLGPSTSTPVTNNQTGVTLTGSFTATGGNVLTNGGPVAVAATNGSTQAMIALTNWQASVNIVSNKSFMAVTNQAVWTYAVPGTNWGPIMSSTGTITRISSVAYSGGTTATLFYAAPTSLTAGMGTVTTLGTMPVVSAGAQSNLSWGIPVGNLLGVSWGAGATTQQVLLAVEVQQ